MQYRVYDRQTLKYVDGGYVKNYSIDDDYIVNNNSTISVVKKTVTDENYSLSKVAVGDIIALIETSGAYHKGVITAVDDTALTISYKSDKELFNDNMLNPLRSYFLEEGTKIAGKFGVEIIINILKALFADTEDDLKRLPIIFIANGDVLDENGQPKMLWTWNNDSIGIVDWLTELFEKYNLTVSWAIDFNIAEEDLTKRAPKYVVTLSAITNSGGIIKDNVDMQTITYTVKEIPDATVCYVIDSNTKELLYVSSGKNLLNPATAKKNAAIYIDDNGNMVFTDKSTNTSLSSFITVDLNKKYTLTQQAFTVSYRLIIVYNKKKEILGYYKYKSYKYTFGGNGENDVKPIPTALVEENGIKRTITITELINNAKYIKVNYYVGAALVQLEEGSTSTQYDLYNKPAIFYLYEKNGEFSISTDKQPQLEDGRERVLPVKTVIATFNASSDGTDETTPEDTAKDKLIPSQFNQAIEIRISADSKMFDFQNAKFGDLYQIINERGNINSVYTGRKSTNDNTWVTLYFGLGRQNYTDLMQMRLRKSRYKEIYNQN